MSSDDETMSLAEIREIAEVQLDQMLRMAHEDLRDLTTEQRFGVITSSLSRLPISRAVLMVGYAVAIERLVMREQLDEGLSER